MQNEDANIEINEENLSYIKEIESNAYFKDYLDDVLLEKSKLPMAYTIQKDDSFNEETHFSLLKELEDKWSYIERNKPLIAKRQHCDTTDSVSLKTNSRSRLQDWKTIIEESKKKYQQQKKANVLPTEDFASFVQAKCEQLQMISNKNSKNSSNINAKDKGLNNSSHKPIVKSFLKQDNSDKASNLLRNSTPIENKFNKPVRVPLLNKTVIGDTSHPKDTTTCLNNKMKDVFYLITDTNNNDNNNNNDIKNKSKNNNENKSKSNSNTHEINTSNRVLSEINEKDLTITKLNRHFDEIMTKIKPNHNNKKEANTLNTSLKVKPRSNANMTNNSIYDYKTSTNEQPKMQFKILKKIHENTVLLNELLPCTKKQKGPFHYYNNAHTTTTNPIRSLIHSSNISHSLNQNKPHLYSKNNFQTTQAKLYAIYSNKITKLMKD